MSISSKVALALSVSAVAILAPMSPAIAAQAQVQHYDLPAQPLAESLRALSLSSGQSIAAPAELLRGVTAPALKGDYTVDQALAALLAGSGLTARRTRGGIVIEHIRQSAAETDEPSTEREVVITGSRIRGAPIASPVIRLDQADMRDAGQTTLADVVRRIPQAFGGGQNLGVGANAAGSIDVGGAVTINLRGLGSDATLTLLNGHRLAYSGSRQGIDVSALPLAAVDRIEIVADGASALYGSDAVAGVANIILRRDHDGVQVEAEGGLATEGGFSRQRYGATAGQRWGSGGIMLSYEYARSTDLLSDERSFARSRPGVFIYPPVERHAAVLAGHQALSDNLTFEIDMLFNRRRTELLFPDNPGGDLRVSRTEQPSTSRSFAVAPALKLDLPGRWQAELSGVYGSERLFARADNFVGTSLVRSTPLCYCNNGKSVELTADGPLFALPGGPARIALGTGYRTNLLFADRGPGNISTIRQSQASYFGYGELNLPLVSPEMAIGAVHRLNLSAALRYERYPGIDEVITPKLGLIYAPSSWIDLKLSWGRSFRAPTLIQLYLLPSAILYPVARLGGTGYPAGATALLLSGGNPELTPERATTLAGTLDLRPPILDGARFQLSYFRTRYTDRVVTPIPITAQSLSNVAYADLVSLAPAPSDTAALIAGSPLFQNASGAPVDLTRVVAIVNNRNRNAGRQTIDGVDMLADYRTRLGSGHLTASLNAAYLRIRQQLAPGQPELARAGLIFTPPSLRARAGLTWSHPRLTLNGSVNFTEGVDDTRTATPVRVRGTTTVDLTARYRLRRAAGPLRDVTLNLSLLNAFNDQPDQIATTSQIDSAFDSANYSPLGRIVSFGIVSSW